MIIYAYTDDIVNKEKSLRDYTRKIASYRFTKLFIGRGYENSQRGNSLLIHLAGDRYLYIGSQIYEFSSPEPITRYYSVVGNSDVPYPLATSQTLVFLMAESTMGPRAYFKNVRMDGDDVYSIFYDAALVKKMDSERFVVVLSATCAID